MWGRGGPSEKEFRLRSRPELSSVTNGQLIVGYSGIQWDTVGYSGMQWDAVGYSGIQLLTEHSVNAFLSLNKS